MYHQFSEKRLLHGFRQRKAVKEEAPSSTYYGDYCRLHAGGVVVKWDGGNEMNNINEIYKMLSWQS